MYIFQNDATSLCNKINYSVFSKNDLIDRIQKCSLECSGFQLPHIFFTKFWRCKLFDKTKYWRSNFLKLPSPKSKSEPLPGFPRAAPGAERPPRCDRACFDKDLLYRNGLRKFSRRLGLRFQGHERYKVSSAALVGQRLVRYTCWPFGRLGPPECLTVLWCHAPPLTNRTGVAGCFNNLCADTRDRSFRKAVRVICANGTAEKLRLCVWHIGVWRITVKK